MRIKQEDDDDGVISSSYEEHVADNILKRKIDMVLDHDGEGEDEMDAPRPADFDLPRIQGTTTYARWKALQDGEIMAYFGRKFQKGSEMEEERFLRVIMSRFRYDDKRSKKKRSNQNRNDSTDRGDEEMLSNTEGILSKKYRTLQPRPADFDLPRIQRTLPYRRWKALQDGEIMVYDSGRKFQKGSEMEEERFLRAIMNRIRCDDKKRRDGKRSKKKRSNQNRNDCTDHGDDEILSNTEIKQKNQNQKDSDIHDNNDDKTEEEEEEEESEDKIMNIPRRCARKHQPSDFDLTWIQRTPIYIKWKGLQDGNFFSFGGRKFQKGSHMDEERLLRTIMADIRDHDHEQQAQQSDHNQNDSNNYHDDDDDETEDYKKEEAEEKEEEAKDDDDVNDHHDENYDDQDKIQQMKIKLIHEMKLSIQNAEKECNESEKEYMAAKEKWEEKKDEYQRLKSMFENDCILRLCLQEATSKK